MPEDTTTTTTTTPPPADENVPDPRESGGSRDSAQGRYFTKDEYEASVTTKVNERLFKEREKYKDYDDLKAKAARFDELEAAQQTELERANARIAEIERSQQEATARAQEAQLRAAVVSEAARRNVVDPDAAIALIDRSALVLDDGGVPTNIAEAMDSLLTAKPYLVAGGSRPTGSADLGARTGAPNEGQLGKDALKSMSPEQIVEARKQGRFKDLASGQTT